MATLDEQIRAVVTAVQKSNPEGKGAQFVAIRDTACLSSRITDECLGKAETRYELVTESNGLYYLTSLGKRFINCGVSLKNLDKLKQLPEENTYKLKKQIATDSSSKIKFSWGEESITRENIAGTDYNIVAVETRGRGTPAKRKDAESKGYILLSKIQLQMLQKIKPYMTDKVVDIEKIATEIGIPEYKLLSIIEAYYAAGINITPQQQRTKLKIEVPTGQQDELNNLLEKYKDGQERSYKAMEYIVKVLKEKDTKINDLEKRIGDLEKLIKK
jgi:hypothetical protein